MGESEIFELKNQLNAISERLTRIETKLQERCDTRGEWLERLENRVRRLENDKYKLIGAATAISVLASQLMKILG